MNQSLCAVNQSLCVVNQFLWPVVLLVFAQNMWVYEQRTLYSDLAVHTSVQYSTV